MINYNIYGQPDTWYSFDGNVSDIKVVNFGGGPLLSYGVRNNRISYAQPIDKSLAFCGIGKECPFSNLTYYHGNGSTLTFEVKQNNTNYFLNALPNIYQSYWQLSSAFTMYDNTETFNIGSWDKAGTNETYCSNWVEPIADFNPKNIVLCIYVDCKEAVNGALSSVTLSDYIDNNGYESVPYVERVYAYPYVGNYNGENTLNRTTPGLAGNFCLTPSTLEYFESSYIDKCNRYNSMNTKNDNSFPLLFTTINTNMQLENLIVFGDFTNDNNFTITQSDTKYWRTSYHVTAANKNEFKEKCLKACAQYGLYFTPKLSVANGADNFTDENMYIGVLDSDGITHGVYLKGEQTAESSQASWNSIRESPYDYTKNDPTDYKNDTKFYGQFYSNSFNKKWVIDATDVDNLSQELFSALNQVPQGESVQAYCQRVFLTNNPIDCIINLKKFPVTIPAGPKQYNIKLGAYTTNVLGAPLLYSTFYFDFSFSNSEGNGLFPTFGDCFLDYEPYTKAELSVPFCGTCEIPCTYLYQYGIKIRLIVDYTSGACTAYIMSRGITIDTLQGNCAVDLPVTGIQSATLDSQIFANAQADNRRMNTLGVSLIGGAVAMAAAIFTGGATAALLGVAGAATGIIGSSVSAAQQNAQIEYNFEHMQLPLKQVSSASPALAQSYDMRCKLRITRPKLYGGYNQAVYANTIGHATCRSTTVAKCTGFTVGMINVNGIPATAEEKEAIKNQFAAGVYL